MILFDITSLLILMQKCVSSILIKRSRKFNLGRISKRFLYLLSLSFCLSLPLSVSFFFQLTQLSLSVKPIGFASRPVSQSYSCCQTSKLFLSLLMPIVNSLRSERVTFSFCHILQIAPWSWQAEHSLQ